AGNFHQPEESRYGQAQEVGSQWTDLEEGGQSAQHCDRIRTTHDRTQERPKTQSGESCEPQSLHITLRESTGPEVGTHTEWRSCREQMSRIPPPHAASAPVQSFVIEPASASDCVMRRRGYIADRARHTRRRFGGG